MRIDLRHIKKRLRKVRRIWPLSLARKVQATFGAAVVLVLALALLIPYIWMDKLTTKGLLDAGRSRSKVLLDRHFQLEGLNQTLRVLNDTGQPRDANDTEIQWIRFAQDDPNLVAEFGEDVNDMVADIVDDDDRDEDVRLVKVEGGKESRYVRIFRATEHCINCHSQQGTASPFILNKPVGAALIRSRELAAVGRTRQ